MRLENSAEFVQNHVCQHEELEFHPMAFSNHWMSEEGGAMLKLVVQMVPLVRVWSGSWSGENRQSSESFLGKGA